MINYFGVIVIALIIVVFNFAAIDKDKKREETKRCKAACYAINYPQYELLREPFECYCKKQDSVKRVEL